MALGGQVVNLVRPNLADDANEAGTIRHVPPMEVDEALFLHVAHPLIQVQMLDTARIEAAASPHDAMHLISLFYQKLRQEASVLPGNTGN